MNTKDTMINLEGKCFCPLFMGSFFKRTIYDDADVNFQRKFKMIKIGFTQGTLKQIKKRFKVLKVLSIQHVITTLKKGLEKKLGCLSEKNMADP